MWTSIASRTSSTRACSTVGCLPSPIPARCAWRADLARSRGSSGDAQEIYGQRIPVDDAIRRIEGLYKPYHRALRRLFTRIHREFGAAVLIDCHSMPSSAGAKDERPRSDVVLGDRYGTSCVRRLPRCAEATLRDAGLFGEPQQALCRGVHHRTLRQSGRRPACHPARAQPRALHGRAAL